MSLNVGPRLGILFEAVGGDCDCVRLADDRLLYLVILVSRRARVDMSRRIRRELSQVLLWAFVRFNVKLKASLKC